jgi:hypothetical protein
VTFKAINPDDYFQMTPSTIDQGIKRRREKQD